MRLFKLKKCKRVHSIHFTPDGTRLLAIGGEEARGIDAAVWLDLTTGENVGRIDQYANCCAVDPQLTRYVVGAAYRGSPLQWTALPKSDSWHAFPGQVQDRKVMPRFTADRIAGLRFDAGGTRLGISWSTRAGNLTSGCEIAILQFNPPELFCRIASKFVVNVFSFNAGVTRLAATGGIGNIDSEPTVEVIELPSGKKVYQFDPPGTVTRCLVFTSDDRLIVANARNVYVLPPDKPEPLFMLSGHKGQVNAVAISPGGRCLLTASHDGAIRVWDAATGEPGPAFDWRIGSVTALAYAPDGLTCAAAGLNGKIVIWDVDE